MKAKVKQIAFGFSLKNHFSRKMFNCLCVLCFLLSGCRNGLFIFLLRLLTDASNDADVTDDEVTASLKGVDLPQLQLELNSLILLKSGLDKYARLEMGKL